MIIKNINQRERLIRSVLGLSLISLGLMVSGPVLTGVLHFAGTVLLLTGIFGWCGIYAIAGFSSIKRREKEVLTEDIHEEVKSYKQKKSSPTKKNVVSKSTKKKEVKKEKPKKKVSKKSNKK